MEKENNKSIINNNESEEEGLLSKNRNNKINESINKLKATSNKKSYKIPEGFEQCLLEFTVDVLKAKPNNIIEHAVQYFTNKLEISKINNSQVEQENRDEMNRETSRNDIKIKEIINDEAKLDASLENDIDSSDENESHSKSRRNSIFTRTYNPEDDNQIKTNYTLNESDNENEEEKLDEINKEKSPEIRAKLGKILRSIVMFKHLYEDDFNQILDNMFEKKCRANEVIIKEGDDGNYFYVIDKGLYEIYKRQQNSFLTVDGNEFTKLYGKKIGEYKNSGYFGELALLYNQPRSATIISVENDGILWAMNRETFQRLVISNAFKRRKLYEEFLKAVPLLKECMNDYERTQVADSLTSHTFNKNDCIIKDGDLANGMFFIEDGEIQIIKETPEGKIFDVILTKGDYFGELALINKTQRSASAFTFSDVCKVAFLEIEAFERLMGPCIDIIKQNISNYRSL